jgi:hypothetical protein
VACHPALFVFPRYLSALSPGLRPQNTESIGRLACRLLRADAFNVFNIVTFTGRQTTIQDNNSTAMTIRNSRTLADGSADPNRLTPPNAGFGSVTSAAALRTIRLTARFSFQEGDGAWGPEDPKARQDPQTQRAGWQCHPALFVSAQRERQVPFACRTRRTRRTFYEAAG